MRNGRSQSGFTLIELLISIAVMGFSISLAMGIFIAQQNSFQSLDLMRVAQEAGRDASLDFEVSLRRVGFGIDPQYALDFNTYPTCANGTFCRDQTKQPDEIVFYARNPNYHWDPQNTNGCTNADGCFTAGKGWFVDSTTVAPTTLVLNTRGGELFAKGQIIVLTQTNGQSPLMVTVSSTVSVAAGTVGKTTIILNSTKTWTNDPYINSIGASPPNPSPPNPPYKYAFLVDRFRYYVAQADGTPYTAQPNSTPYLMFDSGLAPDNVNVERVPVAKNVEDLQIAYVLNTPTTGGNGPDSNTNWIVGDAPGVQEQPNPAAQGPNPDYIQAPPTDASRFTLNPANVRMVRYSFIIRSYRPDPYPTTAWAGDPFPFKENRDTTTGVPALGRYRRVVISGSVALRNMESRNSFVF
jgi:prepilin-type N-terminal cleavage/methylation domain-containing protein